MIDDVNFHSRSILISKVQIEVRWFVSTQQTIYLFAQGGKIRFIPVRTIIIDLQWDFEFTISMLIS